MDEHTRREIEAVVDLLEDWIAAGHAYPTGYAQLDLAKRLRALLPREPELEEVVERYVDWLDSLGRLRLAGTDEAHAGHHNALRAALRRRRGER